MAKRYHEQEVIDMLKAQVEAKKMLFMPNCGCGLSEGKKRKENPGLYCLSET